MAQARSAASPATAVRVRVVAPSALGATAVAALRARGIAAEASEAAAASATANANASLSTAPLADDELLAIALDAIPTAAAAAELAATCARAAATGRPACVLAPAPHGTGRAAVERAAALAYLRAHGAAVGHDVDAWLEAIALLARAGLPAGPRAAIIAPAGSWLEAQARALASDANGAGTRAPFAAGDEPTHAVLYDPALGAPPATLPGMHVPVAARAELADGGALLYTVRAALGAIDVLGRAAERIAVGLGPADRAASAELAIDEERLARQLAKLAPGLGAAPRRLGDHDAKVLLAAYGVPITRQAVATTPSAAVKLARRAGYPVEVKPWGDDLPSEPMGCPVERGVTSDALVRQAFTAVLAAAGKAVDGGAVIVRETPPAGRDVSISFVELPALGWTVVLDAPGAAHPAAAPAPLRLVDAQALAATVVASRAGDPDPDRVGLANLLRRASHLVVDLAPRIVRLDLPRVVVGGRGARTLVVDASAELA